MIFILSEIGIKLIDRQNKPPGFQQEGPIHQHET